MAVLSLGWLGVAAIGKLQQGDDAVSLWEGFRDPLAWLVLLWPAIGQYSTGEAAQVAGQARYVQLLCKLPFCRPGFCPVIAWQTVQRWHSFVPCSAF